MNVPTPEDQSRDYKTPMVLHETAEFDVAADLGYEGNAPVGGFTRCEELHPVTEFDCSQQRQGRRRPWCWIGSLWRTLSTAVGFHKGNR